MSAAAADYWEGVGLYETQRYDEALPRLRAAHRAAPDWAEAARALGQAEFLIRQYKASARAYSRAFEVDPHLGDARDLSYYSAALTESGDLDGGIASIQAAVQRFPYAPGLHASLGDMLVKEKSFAEAYYEYTLELLLHGIRGMFAKGALDGVSNVLAQVDLKKPENHELQLFSIGLNYLQQDQAHEAVHTFQHLLEVSQSATPLTRLLLAEAHLEASDAASARIELERYLASSPDFVPALVLASHAYKFLGENERARAAHQRAKLLFPEYWKLQKN
jgi:tetratricopeptide (TPR) repeat protein